MSASYKELFIKRKRRRPERSQSSVVSRVRRLGRVTTVRGAKTLPRLPIAIPRTKRIALVYYQEFDLTTAGGGYSQVFRGNGPYDPDETGAGSQPTGYDQWAAFYKRYVVHGSKIMAQLHNADNVPTLLGISPNISGSVSTVNADYFTNPMMKGAWTDATGNPNATKTLTMYQSSKDMLGLKDVKDDADASSEFSTFPARQWFWNIYVHNTDAGNLACYLRVTITYYCTLYERWGLTLS